MDELLRDFLTTLTDIVNEKKPWHVKRELILKEASNAEKLALEEFISWFDETGKESE